MNWAYAVCSVVINNIFLFRILFVVESFITFHSTNIVLGRKIKNTRRMIGIAIYNHLFEQWDRGLHVLASLALPQGKGLYIPGGRQAFTLLAISASL